MSKIESHDPRAETTLSAYVLINTKPNSVRKVSMNLKKIEAVDKIYIVYGVSARAKIRNEKPMKLVSEHVLLAIAVIVVSYLIGGIVSLVLPT